MLSSCRFAVQCGVCEHIFAQSGFYTGGGEGRGALGFLSFHINLLRCHNCLNNYNRTKHNSKVHATTRVKNIGMVCHKDRDDISPTSIYTAVVLAVCSVGHHFLIYSHIHT